MTSHHQRSVSFHLQPSSSSTSPPPSRLNNQNQQKTKRTEDKNENNDPQKIPIAVVGSDNNSCASSIISTAISSYSAASSSAFSNSSYYNKVFSTLPANQFNRNGQIHGGDLMIFSATSETKEQGDFLHTKQRDSSSPTFMEDQQDPFASPSPVDLLRVTKPKQLETPTGIYSKEITFGELRPLFSLSRLRMLYEFQLRNSNNPNGAKKENDNNNLDDDAEASGNLKQVEPNPVMSRILYGSDKNNSSNENTSSSSSSPTIKVATFTKTIKKKNILFDFEEEVMEDESILRRRKIRNVAEWFLKINAARKTQQAMIERNDNNDNSNESSGPRLNEEQQALLRAADRNRTTSNNHQQSSTGAKLFNDIHTLNTTNSSSAKNKELQKREVCGHIVTFPALTMILTKSAVQRQSFGSRPLSGLTLLALVCAEHGELEIAVAATKMIPGVGGGLREQLLPRHHRNVSSSPSQVFSERTQALLDRNSREALLQKEVKTIQQMMKSDGTTPSAVRAKSAESSITPSSDKVSKLFSAVSFAKKLRSKISTKNIPKEQDQNNEQEQEENNAVKTTATRSASASPQQQRNLPFPRLFQNAINSVVEEYDKQITRNEIKHLYDGKDAESLLLLGGNDDDDENDNSDSNLTDEQLVAKKEAKKQREQERERRRLAVKFGHLHQPTQNIKERREKQLLQKFENFGRGVLEASQIPRTGFRDPVNPEREQVLDLLISPLQSISDFMESRPFVSDFIWKLLIISSPSSSSEQNAKKNRFLSPVQERYLCLCETLNVKPNKSLLFGTTSASSSSSPSSSLATFQCLEDVDCISLSGNFIGDRGILPVLELTRHHHDLVKGSCCYDDTDQNNSHNNIQKCCDDFTVVDQNRLLLKKSCTLTPKFHLLNLSGNGISDRGCEAVAEWLLNRFIIHRKEQQDGNSEKKNHVLLFSPSEEYKCCSRFSKRNANDENNTNNGDLFGSIRIDLSNNKDIGIGGAMSLIRTLEKIRRVCEKEEWFQELLLLSSFQRGSFHQLQKEKEKYKYEGIFYSPSSHQFLKDGLDKQQDANVAWQGNMNVLKRSETQANITKVKKLLEMSPSMRIDFRERVEANRHHQQEKQTQEETGELETDPSSSSLTKEETQLLFGLDKGGAFFTLENNTMMRNSSQQNRQNKKKEIQMKNAADDRTLLPGAVVDDNEEDPLEDEFGQRVASIDFTSDNSSASASFGTMKKTKMGFTLIEVDLSGCSVPGGLRRRLLDLGVI